MRLQLALILFILHGVCLGQKDTDSTQFRKLSHNEINFVYGYYEQDGNNAAVTGGLGTEELTAHTPKIIVNVPLKKGKSLSAILGVDVYSSASTDNIDFDMSSASSQEAHTSLNLGYSWTSKSEITYTINTNFDIESDYLSRGLGVAISYPLKNKSKLSWSLYAYFDNLKWGWLDPGEWRGQFLIYPEELRDTTWFDSPRRRSFLGNISYTKYVSHRFNILISQDIILQKGLLSTPFHRVYFQEQETPRVENFPSTKFKSASTIRTNYYLSDILRLRLFQRFYWDTFGIVSYTANVELPIKPGLGVSVFPITRFHWQGSSRFFKPYKEHSTKSEYYTSDYDLSSINSYSVGFGVRYNPTFGLFSKPVAREGTVIKGVGLRVLRYKRSDGLTAWMGTLRLTVGKL